MKRFLLILVMMLSACAPSQDHLAKIASLRAGLPYTTTIGMSHSMEPRLMSGKSYYVNKRDYNLLHGGDMAVFWPDGSTDPVCHFVGNRIGTDSWATYGLAQGSDTYRWILTRDNYIGVIY